MDLANDVEYVWHPFEEIGTKKPRSNFIVPPTVTGELEHIRCYDENADARSAAERALSSLRKWRIIEVGLSPLQMGIAESIGDQIRREKLIPSAERHDSFIIGESALLGCDAVLTSDEKMWRIDPSALYRILEHYIDRDSFYVMTPNLALNLYWPSS